MFCVLLCDGHSGAATRRDTGEAQDSQVPKTGSPHALQVTGFGQVSEDQREEKAKARTHCGISAGKAKQGKVNSLGLANFDVSLSFGLQGWSLVAWHLALDD